MTNAKLIAAAKAETNREMAYQAYINEVTPNGNPRIDNIKICAGMNQEHQRHIAAQVNLALQAAWSAARSRVPQLIAALESAETHADRLAAALEARVGGFNPDCACDACAALTAHEARKGGM